MHETPQAGKPTKSPSSGGGIGRVLVVADVYLTMRDAMQATGLLQPTYVVTDEFDYYFVADDNSVFVVREQDFWSPFKRVFISGPRAGQEEPIMRPEADMYQRTAEAIWGRYIKGTLFEGPRFIPGTERKYIDYTETRDGVEYKAGYIDEHGIHRFPQGLQRPILQ